MNEPSKVSNLLSPSQAKIIAFALCSLSLFALLLLLGLVIQSLGEFMNYFSSVLWPLAVAFILAILLRPIVAFLENKLSLGRNLSVFLLYLLVVISGCLILWSVGGEVLRQARELGGASLNWPERIEERVRQTVKPATWSSVSNHFHQFKNDWKSALNALGIESPRLAKGSALVLKDAWSGMSSFFCAIASLAIVPIYLFYFLRSQKDHLSHLVRQFSFLQQSTRDDLVYLLRQFRDIIESFFQGQLVIGLMMGVGYAIGFSVSGLKFGIALGLLFGVLNVVPFLGSVLGFLTVLVVAYLQPGGILDGGDFAILWGCGFTFVFVQFIESYWLSPKVMGERTGLHPVLIIASVFFWGTALGGVLGMILGIPLTAFLIIFWRLLREKYLPA